MAKNSKSEEKYRTLIEQASDGIFIADKNGKYVEVNESGCRTLGYSKEELYTLYIKDVMVMDEQSVPLRFDELIAGKSVIQQRNLKRKDGSVITVEINARQLRDGNMLGIVRDLTDRIESEKKLQKEKELSDKIINSLPGLFYMSDPSPRMLRWNKAFEKISGYSAEELGKITPVNLFVTDDQPVLRQSLEKTYKTGSADVEARLLTKSGEKIPFYFTGVGIEYEENPAILGTGIDISERKKVEHENIKERMENEALINSTSDFLWSVSNDYKLIAANNSFIKRLKENAYYQIKPGDNILSTEYFEEDYLQYWKGFYSKALGGEKVLKEIFTPQPNSSDLLWFELKIDPIFIDNKITGIACSMRDITRRKKENEQIRKVNERFELISKATNDAIWEWNLETNEVWGNEAHQQLYGLKMADKVPDDDEWKKRIHPDDKEQTLRIVSEALVSEQTSFSSEYRLFTENKGWINVLGSTYIDRNNDGKAIRLLGNMTNLTERKKAENALAESENYLRTIVQAEPGCVKLLNINCELLDMNPAGLAMIEADNLAQVKGKTVLGIVKKPYRYAFENLTQNVFKGKSGTLEFEIEGLKGTGRWLETHAVPLKNAGGDIVSLLAVTRDITEKKKAENLLKKSYKDIRRLATHLEQIREDERIRIARDLHDELGQQLTVLKLDISWIRKKISGKEEMMQQKISELLSTVDNTIKTVRRISTELRPSVLDDLGLVAAMEWQSNEFEKRTGIETNLNSEIKEVKLPAKIATGLFRIFQESLTNVARHADATNVNALLGIENGKIRMQIIDNGKGFDQQNIEGKKTLGILGMRERAKIMGGEYIIESKQGKGSVIEVRVPISSITSI